MITVGVKIERDELDEMKRLVRTDRSATALMSMARLGVQIERERQGKIEEQK